MYAVARGPCALVNTPVPLVPLDPEGRLFPVDLTDRLSALSEEISEQLTQLRILDEQVVFQTDVAEEARIRALVSETPLADREAREAADDLRRLTRSREDAQTRVDELRAEQDSLLERMLDDVREST